MSRNLRIYLSQPMSMLGHYKFCNSLSPVDFDLHRFSLSQMFIMILQLPPFFNTSFSLMYSADVDQLLDFMEGINSVFWGYLQGTRHDHH